MPILLIAAVPFLEIYLLFKAGNAFGFVNLIFFLVIKAMIGRIIMRRANLMGTQKDLVTAAAIGLGGFLLTLPALLTSIVGLLILFSPTRWMLSRIFKNAFKKLTSQSSFKVFNFGGMPGQDPFVKAEFKQHFSSERDVTPLVIDVTPIKKSENRD